MGHGGGGVKVWGWEGCRVVVVVLVESIYIIYSH